MGAVLWLGMGNRMPAKPKAGTLSEHLLALARSFEMYPRRAGKSPSEKWERILAGGAEIREWFSPRFSDAEVFELFAGMFDHQGLCDEFYTKALLAAVPGFVTRTASLAPL